MSTTRQERRRLERMAQKSSRKLDWSEIIQLFKYLLLINTAFAALVFAFTWYDVSSQNKIRSDIMTDQGTIQAMIVSKTNRKNTHYSTYNFTVLGKGYHGDTRGRYEGTIGSEICISYYRPNPSINLCCDNMAMQSFKTAVLFGSLKIWLYLTLVSLILIPLVYLWQIFLARKKRGTRYRAKR